MVDLRDGETRDDDLGHAAGNLAQAKIADEEDVENMDIDEVELEAAVETAFDRCDDLVQEAIDGDSGAVVSLAEKVDEATGEGVDRDEAASAIRETVENWRDA